MDETSLSFHDTFKLFFQGRPWATLKMPKAGSAPRIKLLRELAKCTEH